MAQPNNSTLTFINAAIQEIKDNIKELNKKVDDKVVAIYDVRFREVEKDVTDMKARVKLVFGALGVVATALVGTILTLVFAKR